MAKSNQKKIIVLIILECQLFSLSHRVSGNSPLLIVFSANYIDQSNGDLFD